MENELLKGDIERWKGVYNFFIRPAKGGCITGFQHRTYSGTESEMIHFTYGEGIKRLYSLLFFMAKDSAEVKALMEDLGNVSVNDLGFEQLIKRAEESAKAELEDDKI